jgi:hypothetical protein
VVEYTDPDCPFCRKGSEFFRNRRDVTRYVFFNPLPMHPQAREKAQYVLSAQDKAKAYEEVMSGKLDGRKPEGITSAGIKLLEEQWRWREAKGQHADLRHLRKDHPRFDQLKVEVGGRGGATSREDSGERRVVSLPPPFSARRQNSSTAAGRPPRCRGAPVRCRKGG